MSLGVPELTLPAVLLPMTTPSMFILLTTLSPRAATLKPHSSPRTSTPMEDRSIPSTTRAPAFDTQADVHISSGTSIDTLPDPPRITPSTEPGGNIGNLRDEIAAAETAAAKTALVNEYYKSIKEDYKGLPLPKKIPCDQFEVGRDGKTLYWTPEKGKVISIISSRGGGFLALGTLASKYGNGGTDAIRKSMGLKEYDSNTRKTGKLSPKCEKTL